MPDPDAVSLDRLGLMQGLPPPPDRIVGDANRGAYPQLRWALQHVRELGPTRNVRRGALPPSALPAALAFEDDRGLKRGGDREKFKAAGMAFRPGCSYRSQWWVLHDADGAFEASGIHGQMLHVNPAAEMVVVKPSSHPVAGAGYTYALTLRVWDALARAVRAGS